VLVLLLAQAARDTALQQAAMANALLVVERGLTTALQERLAQVGFGALLAGVCCLYKPR
jgi:hypothetical protein